jgi:phosphoserine phosphatase
MTDCRTFTVRLSPLEGQKVEFIARVDETAVNDVFRQALALLFEHKKADADFMARVAATLAADADIASQLQPTAPAPSSR